MIMEWVRSAIGFVITCILAIIALAILIWALRNPATVGSVVGFVLHGIASIGTSIGNAITSVVSSLV